MIPAQLQRSDTATESGVPVTSHDLSPELAREKVTVILRRDTMFMLTFVAPFDTLTFAGDGWIG